EEDFLGSICGDGAPVADGVSDEDFLGGSSDELQVAAAARAAGATGGHPVLGLGPLVLSAADAYTPPAVAKRGRRILPAAARAAVHALEPTPEVAFESAVPRTAAFLLDADAARPSALSSAKKLCQICGLAKSTWRDTAGAIAHCTYQVLRKSVDRFAQSVLGICRGGGQGGSRLQPLVHFRFRCYDGTKQRVRVHSTVTTQGGVRAAAVASVAGEFEVYTSFASRAFCMMKGQPSARELLTLQVREPTVLRTTDGAAAESVHAALAHIRSDADGELDVKPTDTMIVRMQLAMQGQVFRLMQAMRTIIAERLVIIDGGELDDEAAEFSRHAYDARLPVRSFGDKFRRRLLQGLWNGDLRRSDRIEHICRGCCKSRAQTLYVMQTAGLKALVTNVWRVMDRQNWTGAHLCLGGLGLASFVHNLLPSAFLVVFGAQCTQVDGPDGAGDGLDGDLGAEGLERDVEKTIPVSVWGEGNVAEISRAIDWIVSGSFHDSLYLFARSHEPCSDVVLRELERTGAQWELKQRQRVLETGERTRPLWGAADRTDVRRFREQVCDMVVNGGWPLLRSPTELQQLQVFTLCSRLSAAACQLVEVRRRATPCATYSALRDLEALRSLAARPKYTLDTCAEGVVNYYTDRGGVDGAMAKAELSGALQLMMASSAVAERAHSQTLRRITFRSATWKMGAMSLSGSFLFGQLRQWQRSVFRAWGDHADAKTKRQWQKQELPSQQPRRNFNAWVWRAFARLGSGGAFVDQALGGELSARCPMLTPEQRAPYEDLAAVAVQEHVAGRRAFGPSARPSRARPLGRSGCAQPSGIAIEGGADDVMSAAEAAAFASVSIILKGALVEMKLHSAAMKREGEEMRATAARLHRQSEPDKSGLGQEWHLVAGEVPTSVAAGMTVQQSIVPTLQYTRTPTSILSEVLRALDISRVKREADEWRRMHPRTVEAECPKLHAPARPRRWCWEAGYCVCAGASAIAKKFHDQLSVMWRVLAHRLGEKVFNAKLESGVLALRFTCFGVSALGPAPPPGADGESAIVPAGHAPAAEGLHNVALHHGRPWRPTFARMRCEPLGNRPGVAGVAPQVVGEGDGGAAVLGDLTVFEGARQRFNAAWDKQSITVRVHELVADARRVAACRPSRQRILSTPMLEEELWDSKPPPPKPRKRKAHPMNRPERGPRPMGAAPPAFAEALEDVSDGGETGGDKGEVEFRPQEDESHGDGEDEPFDEEGWALFGWSDDDFDGVGPIWLDGSCGGGDDEVLPVPVDADASLFAGAAAQLPGPAGPEVDAPLPPPPPHPARRAGGDRMAAERVFHVPGGKIKYYAHGSPRFAAECAAHAARITSRAARGSPFAARAGQGRPLAFLPAWHSDRPDHVNTQHAHVHGWEPSQASRQAARDRLLFAAGDPVVAAMLGLERPRRACEPEGPGTMHVTMWQHAKDRTSVELPNGFWHASAKRQSQSSVRRRQRRPPRRCRDNETRDKAAVRQGREKALEGAGAARKEKFYKSQSHKSVSPLVLGRRVSHSAGTDACTVVACMSAIKASTLAELDENGSAALPGIGLFEKKVQHATLGGVRNVFGNWVVVSPKPLDIHIRFKPFSELEDVLKDGGDIDPNTTLRDVVDDASIPPTAFHPEDMAAAGLPNGELPEHPASAACIGPLLIREKSATPHGKPKVGKRGYCDAVESDARRFPDVKMPGGPIAKFFHGRSYRFKGYVRGQWHSDFTWAALRAKTAQDHDVSAAFETSCEIASGRASAASSPHDVALKTDTGFTVFSDCMIINEQQCKRDFLPKGASALTPTDAGERITSIKNEHHAAEVSGVLVIDPDQPYTKVRKWSSTYGSLSEWSLQASIYCRDGQGASASGAIEKLMRQMLPTTLRGHVGAPTVAEVQQRAVGAAKANGFVAEQPLDVTPHKPDKARAGSVAERLKALCDGSPGGGGLDGAVSATPPGASSGRIAALLDSSTPPPEGSDMASDVGGAETVRSSGTAAGAGIRRGRSSAKLDAPLDDPDKERLKELEMSISLATLLDKGQGHKFGDNIYALNRFKPRSGGTVGNAHGKLLDVVETCALVGGSAVDTMKRDVRANLLKKLKNAKTSDAYKFKLELVGAAVREATSVSEKVNIIIPWSGSSVTGAHGEFSLFEPLLSEVGLPIRKRAQVCQEFILNHVVLPLTSAERCNFDKLGQLADAIAEHVGTKELRDEVPEDLQPIAQALYTFAESMKALLDPPPGALKRRPARGDVRRFLREEWGGEDWRNVVFTLSDALKECVSECNRAYRTDVKHGETISLYEALLSDTATITPANFEAIFGGLGEWGGQLRKGGATSLVEQIGSSLEQRIQARMATGAEAPQISEDPAKLAAMEIKFTDFTAKAVDFRGIDATCIEKLKDVAVKLRTLAGSLASAAEEKGLLRACASLDFGMPETIAKVRDARQKCIGTKFVKADTVKKLMARIDQRTVQCAIWLVKIAPEQVVDCPFDDITKVSGLGISLVVHVEPSAIQRGKLMGDKMRPSGLFQFGKALKALNVYEATADDFDFGGGPSAAEAWVELEAAVGVFRETVTPEEVAEQPTEKADDDEAKADNVDQGGECIHVGPRVGLFALLSSHVDAMLNICFEKLAAFSDAFWASLMKPANEKLAELGSIAGGDLQGNTKHWAGDMHEKQTLDSTLAHASKTLFRQKGMSAKISKVVTSIKAALHDSKGTAELHGATEAREAMQKALACEQRRSSSMLWEAKALQILKMDVTDEGLADKLSAVRDAVRDAEEFGETDVSEVILKAVSDRLAQ
ncbi:unnamed protein product, partial [Prorocentrum cordatum]